MVARKGCPAGAPSSVPNTPTLQYSITPMPCLRNPPPAEPRWAWREKPPGACAPGGLRRQEKSLRYLRRRLYQRIPSPSAASTIEAGSGMLA